MTDSMEHLSQAVKVSAKIHQLKEKLEATPVKVREIEGQLEVIQKQYQERKVSWDQMDSEKRKLEAELQTDHSTLEQKEERLNSIKTQKEYQAVVREIATTKTANKEREERIKKLSEDLASYQSELAPLETQLKDLQSQADQARAEIQGTLDEIDAEIKSLQTQLEEQLKALPDDIRSKYLQVEERKQPPAALVIEGTCQECFMSLPPQLFIELQKKHQVHSCPNCHRLLYLEED